MNPKIVPNSKGKVRVPNSMDLNSILRCRDPNFVNLIRKCLVFDPNERFNPDEALSHPWILEGLPPNLQAQHLKLIQTTESANAASIKASDGSPYKEPLRPEIPRKLTEERARSSRGRETRPSVLNSELSVNRTRDDKVKVSSNISENAEAMFNVTITVDNHNAENIKPSNDTTYQSPLVNLSILAIIIDSYVLYRNNQKARS